MDIANNMPVSTNQNLSVLHDRPSPIYLSGSDPDNDRMTFSILSNPSNGL